MLMALRAAHPPSPPGGRAEVSRVPLSTQEQGQGAPGEAAAHPAALPGSVPVLSRSSARLHARPMPLPGSVTIPRRCWAPCLSLRLCRAPGPSHPIPSCSSALLHARPILQLCRAPCPFCPMTARLCAHPRPQLRRGRTKPRKDHAVRVGTSPAHLQECGRGILGNVYYTGNCLESSFILIVQLSI